MIEVKKLAAQGDCLFRRVPRVPAAWTVESQVEGELVVAHSETGHHHVALLEQPAQLFSNPADAMVSYLRVPAAAKHVDVEHRRPFDTHETLRLLCREQGETVFEIRRQREYVPEGWRRVED